MGRSNDGERADIFFLIVTSLGAIINALVLLCIQRNPLKCFRNSSSYLVGHQSFSDMITCLFMAGYYIATFFDDSITKIFPTIIKIFVVLSVTGFVALFLVSLDRFLAIRFPIRYRIYVKSYLVPTLVVPIWLCTLVLILLIVFQPASNTIITMFLLVSGGILVFTKLCLHCIAFWTIKAKGSQLRRNESQTSNGQSQQVVALKRETRFLFTVFLITVVVLLTTIPLLTSFYIYGDMDSFHSFSGLLVFTSYWMGVIIGPCIYFIRLNNYHASLKKIICF